MHIIIYHIRLHRAGIVQRRCYLTRVKFKWERPSSDSSGMSYVLYYVNYIMFNNNNNNNNLIYTVHTYYYIINLLITDLLPSIDHTDTAPILLFLNSYLLVYIVGLPVYIILPVANTLQTGFAAKFFFNRFDLIFFISRPRRWS
jgi:hypothetical protein